jgi:hypothetical protein
MIYPVGVIVGSGLFLFARVEVIAHAKQTAPALPALWVSGTHP